MSYKIIAPNYYSRLKNVLETISKNKNKTLLNLGCSDGEYDLYLKRHYKKIISLDINKNDLKIAKKINSDISYILADVQHLPFKNSIFDEIVCVDVLEHSKNDASAAKEISRVLKKHSFFILTVPNKNYPITYDIINTILKLFNRHLPIGLWGFGHKRLYDAKRIKLLFKNFEILEIRFMLHVIAGFFENYYLVNLIQPLTKSDPKNEKHAKRSFEILKARALAKPPKVLTFLRDFVIQLDELFCKNKKSSLGILAKLQKI